MKPFTYERAKDVASAVKAIRANPGANSWPAAQTCSTS